MIAALWWALSGTLLGCGVVAAVAGIVGTTAPKGPGLSARWRHRGAGASQFAAQRRALIVAAVVSGVAVWLITGVFVPSLIVAAAVVGVPWLIAPASATKAQLAKRDALAEWAQRLADVIRLGFALEQALITSRKHAPQALEREIEDLADKVQSGWPTVQAIEEFAAELDDVTADKVAAALKLSATDQGPGLATAMSDLAESVRKEVAVRQQIEADREKSRTTVKMLTLITLVLVAGGFAVPQYTGVYATWLGQGVLAVIAMAYVAVLVWGRSYATRGGPARVLVPDPRSPVKIPPQIIAEKEQVR